mgnify:CR=1 FL=1
MKTGLDTSIVVRLLSGEPRESAAAALRFLLRLKADGGQAVISDLVAAESYYALHHHYGVSKADALAALGKLFAAEGVECVGEAADVLGTPSLASADPGFVDRIIYQQYLRAGVNEVITLEKAAKKLSRMRLLG